MGKAESHVEFNTMDYPHGLMIHVDDRLIYLLQPCSHNAAPIDGTGWAEAAFDEQPDEPPDGWPGEWHWPRKGETGPRKEGGPWGSASSRTGFSCCCGATHATYEEWTSCKRTVASLYRWAREEGGPPEAKGFGLLPLAREAPAFPMPGQGE